MNQPAGAPTAAPSAYPSHSANGYHQASTHDAQSTAAAALSQHSPSSDTTISNGRKRKASGVPGSRGVANLTPEQLAKKRANDREAQRAIRERTRNTIDSLERRIKELESQQPFQELQRVIAERDDALRQVHDLRQKLGQVAQVVSGPSGSVMSAGQQHMGGHAAHNAPGGLNGTFEFDDLLDTTWLTSDGDDAELAALTAQQSPLPPLGHLHPQQHTQQHYPPGSGPAYDPQLHPDLTTPSQSGSHTSPGSSAASVAPMYSAGEGTLRRWSPSMERQSDQQSQYAQPNGYHQQPLQNHSQQTNGERTGAMGVNFLLGTPNGQADGPAARFPAQDEKLNQAAYSPERSRQAPTPPTFARLPNNSAPTCPLDDLLSNHIASRRQLLADGASTQEVLGPAYPCFAALHDLDRQQDRACHPVSALLIEILSKFPDISALPERVAVLYIMFLVMRWFICPCETCYERLPEWARPVTEQLEMPHATWVDNLPWYDTLDPSLSSLQVGDEASGSTRNPAAHLITEILTSDRPHMRRVLTLSSVDAPVKFEEFFVPYTTTLSLNWPYPKDQVLIQSASADENAMTMNPVFEAHLRDLGNWSLGKEFEGTFPGLVGDGVRILD